MAGVAGQEPLGQGSRQMLRRLRDVMAQTGSVQERLDHIVQIIAADMVAEVCSIYVRRSQDQLELRATEGLNSQALHRTRLNLGEGLVGDIAARARPLALADAQSHTKFAYRPETGEEVYQSLMGVPVLRSRRVLGVLVVQNRTSRVYAEEEVETLEIFAMVLADLLADGREGDGEDAAGKPSRVAGISVVGGMGLGQAHLHRPDIAIRRVVAEDPAIETTRLERAFRAMQDQLDDLIETAGDQTGEHRDVLEAYGMFARDAGFLARMKEGIDGGLTAEASVQKSQRELRVRMSKIADPYLRERLVDFEELANRLLTQLVRDDSRGADAVVRKEVPADAVVVAGSMGPADLLDYDRAKLRGLVLEEGSANSHVAIVARALDIPFVARATGLLSEVEAGDVVMVDGDNGQVFLRPGDEVHGQFQRSLAARHAERARYAEIRDLPARTLDGVDISISMNAGLLVDLPQLEATGADGVGLYRTELPFMVRRDYPDVSAQTDLYRRIFEGGGGRPVVFRTLDAGGDKQLQAFSQEVEENPAMGWRSLRIGLDRPSLLRQQLRALIAAAEGRPLDVMFPMVAETGEFRRARDMLDLEFERARQRGTALPSVLRVGAMFEVPSLAFQLDELLSEVDFLSVGSNDLLQFVYAADRGNERLAARYDPLSRPFLTLLRTVAQAGARAGVPVTLCGEMAGRPVDAIALIGLGYRGLSMNPAAIGPVKQAVLETDAAAVTAFVETLLGGRGFVLRSRLTGFARDHGIST
jgi:phosphotransferase system enzyme I (PtsP)